MHCAVAMCEKCYIPLDEVRKKRKMFSHTLLGLDEIRVLAGGAGYIKGTVSPAERCDFVSVNLEKVHELFQVCRICGKGVVFYKMAQYGLHV